MKIGVLVISCATFFSAATSALAEQDFDFSAADFSDRLVVITCSSATESWYGAGFVAESAGKKYIFTNQHILLGAEKIGFKTSNGKALRPRKVEFSNIRNLARLEAESDSAFQFSAAAQMDDAVAVFGNEDGESSEYFGAINGVGADFFETTAEFTRENGGAPVLNRAGEVVAMASHVRKSHSHAMKEGTKFEDRTRRFCDRLSGVQWKAVNWKPLNAEFGQTYRTSDQLVEKTYDLLYAWFEDPFQKIELPETSDRKFSAWANSHNAAMGKVSGSSNRRSRNSTYTQSLNEFSEVCSSRARKLELLSERRELTGFMRNEFQAQASALEYAVKYIKRRGDTIHTYSE